MCLCCVHLCYVQALEKEKNEAIKQLEGQITVLTSQLESTDKARLNFEGKNQKLIEKSNK